MTTGPHSYLKTLVGTFLCLIAATLQAEEPSDAELFQSRIEPLLKEKCLPCHSHSARQMEGGLTLDSRSGWATGGDSGPAIVPGRPDESLLIKAVRYDDSDLQMPPDEKLTDEEIALLADWVQRGAFDPRKETSPQAADTDWWSLKKLVAPDVPGAGHPLDAFINRRLKENELQPVDRADRVTLIRRLYVDLHGLLPTPEDVQSFVGDDAPDAYEKLVDRLLDSPRYGERWARHWLDVVHFADSHGCEHDVKRENAWRYRDYVIDRLNADVPWANFIREQTAPDVFYPEEPQLMAGLGFIAAGPLELSRASTAPVTFDYLDRDDMVSQTMAAFVSTTANCARCHAHKFDPITQEDYYSLQAVFAGIGKGDIEFDASAEVLRRRQELESLLAAAETRDPGVLLQEKYSGVVDEWAAARQEQPAQWKTLNPDVFLSAGGATLKKLKDRSILASGTVPDQEHYTVTSSVDLQRLTALRLDVLPDESLPMKGPGRAANGNLHLTEVVLHWFPTGSESPTSLKVARTSADYDQPGWTSVQAIDGDLQSGWAIHPQVNQSHHIVFELEAPIDVSAGGKLAVTLKQLYPPKHVIGRFRLAATDAKGEAARALPAEVTAGLARSVDQRTQAESTAIAAVALKEYAQLELSQLPPRDVVYGVSSSWSHAKKLASPQAPKTVHLLRRGAFDKPVKEVGPGSLTAIEWLPARFDLSDPKQESLRRAALADWLAHRDNPLTWRSIVNRVWHYHFGRGLCDTPNDFGRMGSQPSHPELLDWLAVWFRDDAQGSLKKLHRLILTSDAWQRRSTALQSSSAVPAESPSESRRGPPSYSEDADNRLLWRMNRPRFDPEVFRDSVLQMAGRLDLTMGGPGIEQFTKSKGRQVTPVLDYSAFDWESSEARRRSVYRVVWRGIPDPFMEAMDFPDLGLLPPQRGFSVSALQSLTMFNNDFVLHGSQWIAQQIEQEQPDLDTQVARAVELAWLRQPGDEELAGFVNYAKQHGLAAFCRVLLNSNEFLFVD
ncbi:MAG: PSD1 and planctomycete cytochrome C domain-containing protein [Planctomycetota bacterium]